MKAYLTPQINQGTIRITRTVQDETLHKFWDIAAEIASQQSIARQNVRRMVDRSVFNYRKLLKKNLEDTIVNDDINLLPKVSDMYKQIWSDPTKNEKVKRWAERKKQDPSAGPPVSPDLIILSTAASLTKKNQVELVTLDNDFIIFAEEIEKEFDVIITNGFLLRPR